MHRRGTIFLFALAVLGVLFSLAYGLMSSSALASVNAFQTDPDALADQAADEAIAHAIGVIHQDFADFYEVSVNGASVYRSVPTHMGQNWMNHFWPIDTYDSGGRGKMNNVYDRNENDSPLANYLNEYYRNHRGATRGYKDRWKTYTLGFTIHPGIGRWYEPGVWLNEYEDRSVGGQRVYGDPLDLSYQLSSSHDQWAPHPINPNASDPDVAVNNGEPHNPGAPIAGQQEGLFEPMRYDANLLPTSNPSRVRFRLRYAVAVEPLDGKLTYNMQDAYGDPSQVAGDEALTVTSAAAVNPGAGISATPTLADVDYHSEFDESRLSYVAAISEVINRQMVNKGHKVEMSFGGRGHQAWLKGDAKHLKGVATASGGDRALLTFEDNDGDERYIDDDNASDPIYSSGVSYASFPDAAEEMELKGGRAMWQLVGPLPSFRSLAEGTWANRSLSYTEIDERFYATTPFGMLPKKFVYDSVSKPQPTLWNEGFSDQPIRVNVPVMSPRVWYPMILGFVPQEVKSGRYNTYNYEVFSGVDANGAATYKGVNPKTSSTPEGIPWDIPLTSPESFAAMPMRNLFTELAADGYFDKRGGINPGLPYPGTDTDWQDPNGTLAVDWTGSEGEWVHVAEEQDYSLIRAPGIDSGVKDSRIPYQIFFNVEMPKGPDANGDGFPDWTKTKVGTSTGEQFQSKSFYWQKSYWLDITAAMVTTLSTVQQAWLYLDGGYDPTTAQSGWPQWRDIRIYDESGNEYDYFNPDDAPGFSDATSFPAKDYDIDGNSIVDRRDVPSAFDSVREIDQQFLRSMGEVPYHFATGDRPDSVNPLTYFHGQSVPGGVYRQAPIYNNDGNNELRVKTDKANDWGEPIKEQLRSSMITAHQAALMELVLNDTRMSFFGASPQYIDDNTSSASYGAYDFRPMDFDDDGIVRCSCYKNGWEPVESFTSRYDLDGNGSADVVHGGRVPDPNPAAVTQDKIFSLTGYFMFQKSRYYRIFVRGEVYDELRNAAIARRNYEVVYVVDPDGDMWDIQNSADPATVRSGLGAAMSDSHVLFQKKHYNAYLGNMTRVSR